MQKIKIRFGVMLKEVMVLKKFVNPPKNLGLQLTIEDFLEE